MTRRALEAGGGDLGPFRGPIRRPAPSVTAFIPSIVAEFESLWKPFVERLEAEPDRSLMA